ncbi:hypothetical protein C8R44DRAFT_742305 [Mycena epipterygia]|nr:hypothetical protein C8R44DRAFT_742305 [Mycena epipterygia]
MTSLVQLWDFEARKDGFLRPKLEKILDNPLLELPWALLPAVSLMATRHFLWRHWRRRWLFFLSLYAVNRPFSADWEQSRVSPAMSRDQQDHLTWFTEGLLLHGWAGGAAVQWLLQWGTATLKINHSDPPLALLIKGGQIQPEISTQWHLKMHLVL